ncbi:MAG: integrase, partial [Actinomycetota bacterium]|nr:integrase [Actinomycetota bacterium]
FTGLRWSEIAGLQKDDLNVSASTLRVDGSVKRTERYGTKYSQELKTALSRRTVYIPTLLSKMIDEHAKTLEGDFLFPSPKGQLLDYSNWRDDAWNPAVAATGFPFTFHDLRHTYSAVLDSAGAPLDMMQKQAGHSTARMTVHYSASFTDRVPHVMGEIDRIYAEGV